MLWFVQILAINLYYCTDVSVDVYVRVLGGTVLS